MRRAGRYHAVEVKRQTARIVSDDRNFIDELGVDEWTGLPVKDRNSSSNVAGGRNSAQALLADKAVAKYSSNPWWVRGLRKYPSRDEDLEVGRVTRALLSLGTGGARVSCVDSS